MVANFGGGIIPSENGSLRVQTREGDEILGLRHIERLPVNPRRHTDHSPASIAEWNRVYGFLNRTEIRTAVLRHREHPGRGRHETQSRSSRLLDVGKRDENEDQINCIYKVERQANSSNFASEPLNFMGTPDLSIFLSIEAARRPTRRNLRLNKKKNNNNKKNKNK